MAVVMTADFETGDLGMVAIGNIRRRKQYHNGKPMVHSAEIQTSRNVLYP